MPKIKHGKSNVEVLKTFSSFNYKYYLLLTHFSVTDWTGKMIDTPGFIEGSKDW